MLHRAHDIYRHLRTGVRTTMQLVADLAEAVGVPSTVASLLRRGNGAGLQQSSYTAPVAPDRSSPVVAEPPAAPSRATPEPEAHARPERTRRKTTPLKARRNTGNGSPARQRRRTGRRSVVGNQQLPDGVQALQVDDAISGSTYLARIIWALGVAQLEGIGPLRPADIARMVMARSAVSLEPPNVARYIRRSNPTCISVDHTEGSSNFYKLNADGKRIFNENFRAS